MNTRKNTQTKIRRGEVYWYSPPIILSSTSIQQKPRPVLIVSNNICNENSPIISGRCMTTQEKNSLPTHVSVYIDGVENTILCEQELAVVKNRLKACIGRLDYFTMHQVERAIMLQYEIAPIDHIKCENNIEDFSVFLNGFYTENRYWNHKFSEHEKREIIKFCEFRETHAAESTCIKFNLDIRSLDTIYSNICKYLKRDRIELPSDKSDWHVYISSLC